MESDDDEEEDFSTVDLNDPVCSEEPMLNVEKLCIHQILSNSIINHTPRAAPLPLQPIQEEALPEAEPMDVLMPDDLPDIIDVPEEELYSDF